MAELLYQGHGSLRFTTDAGTVIYLDPYAGKGYDLPADLILSTHEHHDHNVIDLPAKKDGCAVVRAAQALENGVYKTFTFGDVSVEAVPAYNGHHSEKECVGYLLRFDGLCIYASGDTSTTAWMKTDAPKVKIDYAFFPIDGIYNMNAAEASECAKVIGAKYNVPIHMKPGGLFDRALAEAFVSEGRIIVADGETLKL